MSTDTHLYILFCKISAGLSASKRILALSGIIKPKIQSVNYTQQRHKPVIATKEFPRSPDAKMVS